MEEFRKKGIRLLDQGRKRLIRLVFSRTGLITALLLLQIAMMLAGFLEFQEFLPHFMGLYILFSVFMVLYLFNTECEPTVKLTWLVVIMLAPVAGSLFYLFTKSEVGHRLLRSRLGKLREESRGLLVQQEEVLQALADTDPGAAAMARYVQKQSGFPVYAGTEVTYFTLGEEKFAAMLHQLEQAQKSIYLEYYIVDEGEMWGAILEVLARKAAQGVDVRVMYDGTCEFYLLPRDYPEKLRELGIACRAFAPVMPFVSTHYNYRDHRKILVIDGEVAFTGGVNLADEYINRRVKYGHWKDTAVMLRGDGARSFSLMFLQMWSISDPTPDLAAGLPSLGQHRGGGFVMPYGTSPLDGQRVGERVYLDILNRAKDYVHIMTPYLILDHELESALCYAARRGVDVVLILPGIPDKQVPYALAKTHFKTLMEAGVEIRRYDPGFVHAKSFVCDGREAVVGTINLDYRSLYHHFECAVWMHSVPAVADIESDFLQTRARCTRITEEILAQDPPGSKILGFLLKFLAPLL